MSRQPAQVLVEANATLPAYADLASRAGRCVKHCALRIVHGVVNSSNKFESFRASPKSMQSWPHLHIAPKKVVALHLHWQRQVDRKGDGQGMSLT